MKQTPRKKAPVELRRRMVQREPDRNALSEMLRAEAWVRTWPSFRACSCATQAPQWSPHITVRPAS